LDGHEKRRNDKKRAITQAALELFSQYGFDKVTLVDVAEKAHVSKVSIYNFFESKDNLRRVIVDEILDEALSSKRELLAAEIPFLKKINILIEIQRKYYEMYGMHFFFEAIASDPNIKTAYDKYVGETNAIMMKFIDMGKQAEVFSADISNTAFEIFIDIFQSYFINDSKKSARAIVEHNPVIAQELFTLLLHGLIQQKEE
jgi:AcrR family transcriptional regulator